MIKSKKIRNVIIGLAVVVVFIMARDWMLKGAVSTAASNVLGAPVKIDHFSISFIRHSAKLSGLKVSNPEGFPPGTLLLISAASVNFDLPAILKKDLHLNELIVHVDEVVVVKNKEGVLNVDSLKVAKKEKDKPSEPMKMRIDTLKLKLGKVVSKDYTKSKQGAVEVYEIGGKEETYQNIASGEQLASLILMGALKHTAIKGALIYGAATVAGASLLPVGIAVVAMGDDSSAAEFAVGYDRVYETAAEVLGRLGSLKSQDKASGVLKGDVQGASVTITVKKEEKIRVSVAARKMLMPQQKTAAGVLYEISEKLKK